MNTRSNPSSPFRNASPALDTSSASHHLHLNNMTNNSNPPVSRPALTNAAATPSSLAPPSTAATSAGGIAAVTNSLTGAGPGNNSTTTPLHHGQTVVEESSEQVLLASFKAAALSVTQLYKDSLKHQKAEQAKGYEAALQDFMSFISNHPAVLEKKERGQTEDEIRHSTSLSVDDIVTFIRNAQSLNCNSASQGNEPQQQQQAQQHQQAHEHQEQQQLHLHQQQHLHAQAQAQAHAQQQQQQQQLQQQQQQVLLQQQQQQQQQQHEQQQAYLQQQQQHHPQGISTAGAPGGMPVPASIFPSEGGFTFTAPIFHSAMDQTMLQGLFPGAAGPEGGIGQQMAVDSLKRRYALQDFNAMATSRMGSTHNGPRLTSGMNLDAFTGFHDQLQPPFKRGRRREGE